jgi:hypothetical protein
MDTNKNGAVSAWRTLREGIIKEEEKQLLQKMQLKKQLFGQL